MKTSRRILATAFALACIVPSPAHAGTVYQCLNSSGKRVLYTENPASCPTGTTPREFTVVNICVIPTACVTSPPPPEAEPLEYICCAFVSGDSQCVHVNEAFDCPPDEYLATCETGVTETDGTVTCYD